MVFVWRVPDGGRGACGGRCRRRRPPRGAAVRRRRPGRRLRPRVGGVARRRDPPELGRAPRAAEASGCCPWSVSSSEVAFWGGSVVVAWILGAGLGVPWRFLNLGGVSVNKWDLLGGCLWGGWNGGGGGGRVWLLGAARLFRECQFLGNRYFM